MGIFDYAGIGAGAYVNRLDEINATRLRNMKAFEELRQLNPEADYATLHGYVASLSGNNALYAGMLPSESALQTMAQRDAETKQRRLAAEQFQDFQRQAQMSQYADKVTETVASRYDDPAQAAAAARSMLPPNLADTFDKSVADGSFGARVKELQAQRYNTALLDAVTLADHVGWDPKIVDSMTANLLPPTMRQNLLPHAQEIYAKRQQDRADAKFDRALRVMQATGVVPDDVDQLSALAHLEIGSDQERKTLSGLLDNLRQRQSSDQAQALFKTIQSSPLYASILTSPDQSARETFVDSYLATVPTSLRDKIKPEVLNLVKADAAGAEFKRYDVLSQEARQDAGKDFDRRQGFQNTLAKETAKDWAKTYVTKDKDKSAAIGSAVAGIVEATGEPMADIFAKIAQDDDLKDQFKDDPGKAAAAYMAKPSNLASIADRRRQAMDTAELSVKAPAAVERQRLGERSGLMLKDIGRMKSILDSPLHNEDKVRAIMAQSGNLLDRLHDLDEVAKANPKVPEARAAADGLADILRRVRTMSQQQAPGQTQPVSPLAQPKRSPADRLPPWYGLASDEDVMRAVNAAVDEYLAIPKVDAYDPGWKAIAASSHRAAVQRKLMARFRFKTADEEQALFTTFTRALKLRSDNQS